MLSAHFQHLKFGNFSPNSPRGGRVLTGGTDSATPVWPHTGTAPLCVTEVLKVLYGSSGVRLPIGARADA